MTDITRGERIRFADYRSPKLEPVTGTCIDIHPATASLMVRSDGTRNTGAYYVISPREATPL